MPLQVHPPLFERCHDRQQFLIVDRVVQFCRCEFARIETDGVQVAVCRGLGQDAAECEVGGVCFDRQGLSWLKMSQNWSCCEGVLQSSESLLRCWRPDKLGSFSGEGGERGSDGRVVVDEISVEVSKSEVRLHFLHNFRGRPIQYSRNLSWIHAYPLV